MAVERKDIEIFFKIEGLEAYITDLETLDSVLKQVDTATKQVKETTNELETATESYDDLEQKLQAMEGATKALAGGLELLAGAAGLAGLEDNEFFKELEENTLNILALARGAIDLSEGVAILARNQKLAAAAQAAFNAVANANPYVLLAGAIIAAGGALLLFAGDSEKATEETKDLNAELDKQLDRFNQYNSLKDKEISNRSRLLQAQQGELKLSQEIAFINERIALRKEDIASLEAEELKIISQGVTEAEKERLATVREALSARRQEVTNFQLEIEIAKAEDARKRREAKANKDDTTAIADETDRIRQNLEALPKIGFGKSTFEEDFDKILSRFRELRGEIEATKQLIVNTNTEVGTSSVQVADSWAVTYKKAFDQVLEEPSKGAELLKRDTKAAIDFANNLNTIFTKDNEKRAERNFKLNKALALSTAIINTAEAVTLALTDKSQPSTLLRILQTAAVAAAGAAQIATISRQKFQPNTDSSSAPPPPAAVPPPPAPAGVTSVGTTIQPGQLSTGQSITQSEPVRAYVLVSDVNNAQQANSQIENLAKL